MGKTMPVEKDSSVQCKLEGYLLADSLDTPGNGRTPKSEVRILRLVMTPTAGCELLRRLRRDHRTGDVPVVIFTD